MTFKPRGSKTFLNEDDELSFFQLVHIRDAERVVRRLNRIVLEGRSVAPEVASQPEVERARAWREFAHEGLDVLALRDTQLVTRYPVTEDEAAALQADLAAAAEDPDHELADVVTFTLEAGRAELVFDRDESKGFVTSA